MLYEVITRAAQDDYALASHQKAAAAWASGALADEVAPCHLLGEGPPLTQDNLIRADARITSYNVCYTKLLRLISNQMKRLRNCLPWRPWRLGGS